MNRRGNFPFKLEKMSEVGEGKFTICKGVIGVYICTGTRKWGIINMSAISQKGKFPLNLDKFRKKVPGGRRGNFPYGKLNGPP